MLCKRTNKFFKRLVKQKRTLLEHKEAFLMENKPKEVTPVNDTLNDLLNNPFSTPTDKLTQTQQSEINALQEQQTATRLIEKLPVDRQEQAK